MSISPLSIRDWSVLALALGAVACGDAPESAGAEAEVEATADQVVPPPEVPVDTTAEAVWTHLQSESYADSWSMWPGTEALYAGTDPHGMLLTTYVNQAAARGLDMMATGAEQALPPGAIVVKENFMPDSTLASVTVMYKAEFYNPEHHDWFFMKRLTDGTVEAAGRVEGCQSCHADAAETDYLFTEIPSTGGES